MKKTKILMLKEKRAALVNIEIAFAVGSLLDPEGLSGLMAMTQSMMLRGTEKHTAEEFALVLDNIGAEIYVSKGLEFTKFHGIVLKEKLKPFLSLFFQVLTKPRFSAVEFKKVKMQYLSALKEEEGSDESISARRFREYILYGHGYSRSNNGSITSVSEVGLRDIKKCFKESFSASDMIISVQGDVEKELIERFKTRVEKALPQKNTRQISTTCPKIPKGRNLVLVDKPDMTQAQIYIGHEGISFHDSEYFALTIANHIFGGSSFSAHLMKEIREKRGWSYGAYSWFQSARNPLYHVMHTVPSNKDTIPAVNLMLQLFQSFVAGGLSRDEFKFAQKSLVNQSAFIADTNRKRLGNKVNQILYGLPRDYYDEYQTKLRAQQYDSVKQAIANQFSQSNCFVFMLCSVDQIKKDLSKLKLIDNHYLFSYQDEPKSLSI